MSKKREYGDAAEHAAKRRICKAPPGDPLDYISPFAPRERFLTVCRVSERFQDYRGNNSDQSANLRSIAVGCGGKVVHVWEHTGSGADPSWLEEPAKLAKQLGATLLAETTDRFIRHPAYHSKHNQGAQARDCDLEDMRYWTDGVELMTHLRPDATPAEVRSYQRKRGQAQKQRQGGRPKKAKRGNYKVRIATDELALLRVILLRHIGFKYREIAEIVGWPAETVRKNFDRKVNLSNRRDSTNDSRQKPR